MLGVCAQVLPIGVEWGTTVSISVGYQNRRAPDWGTQTVHSHFSLLRRLEVQDPVSGEGQLLACRWLSSVPSGVSEERALSVPALVEAVIPFMRPLPS